MQEQEGRQAGGRRRKKARNTLSMEVSIPPSLISRRVCVSVCLCVRERKLFLVVVVVVI
jgi:hypothetical protein